NLTARKYQHVALLYDNYLDPVRTQSFVGRAYVSRRPHLCRYDLDLHRLACSLDFLPLGMGLWIGHIVQQSNARGAGPAFTRKLELLCGKAGSVRSYSRHIAGWPGVVFGEAKENRIGESTDNDGDLGGRFCGGNGFESCPRQNDVRSTFHHLCCNLGQPIRMKIGHCISHVEVPTLDIAKLSHA